MKQARAKDKYVKNGFIMEDRRFNYEFKLILKKEEEERVNRCCTRADTKEEARRLVEAVAMTLVLEDGWKEYEVQAA
jgi:hypothetical protein